jgi:hypothetical protein
MNYDFDFMEKWADELEKDKWRQTDGALSDYFFDRELKEEVLGYCCLGVAVCLHTHEEPGVEISGGTLPRYISELYFQSVDDPFLLVPEEIMEEHAEQFYEGSKYVKYNATELNDQKHLSFKEIAACIRYTIKKEKEKRDGKSS